MVSWSTPLALVSGPCGAYYPLAGCKTNVNVPFKTNNSNDISVMHAQSKQRSKY